MNVGISVRLHHAVHLFVEWSEVRHPPRRRAPVWISEHEDFRRLASSQCLDWNVVLVGRYQDPFEHLEVGKRIVEPLLLMQCP